MKNIRIADLIIIALILIPLIQFLSDKPDKADIKDYTEDLRELSIMLDSVYTNLDELNNKKEETRKSYENKYYILDTVSNADSIYRNWQLLLKDLGEPGFN